MTDKTAAAKRVRALIVDDEPIARRGLRQLLQTQASVEIIGECVNGRDAVESIATEKPDLVYLDIQMPGGDGFSVLREIGAVSMPCVIFVTAFDEFALQAFSVAATDYIVKPYSPERLYEATTRALKRIHDERVVAAHERLLKALDEIGTPQANSADGERTLRNDYATRLLVSIGARNVVVPLAEVSMIEADGYYVRVSATSARYTLRESLRELELRLDPREFMRVHRSAIIRISAVRTVERADQERSELVLADGTHVPISRARRDAVLRTLGSIRG